MTNQEYLIIALKNEIDDGGAAGGGQAAECGDGGVAGDVQGNKARA